VKLFETLKRLFEPRARPPVETMGAPADRPPPPEPTLREPELPQPTRSEPPPPSAIPAAEVQIEDEALDIVEDRSDVSEVRALLEEVAQAPNPAEPVAEPPAPTLSSEPTLFEEPTQEVVAPTAIPQQVGDALVLTLATPPATFTVAKAAATIGRGQENTIRLDDLSVSRRHARIAYKQGSYWLSDTGSMGGTWVDGTRLNAPHRIGSGQVIDIGLCRLTVSLVAGAEPADKKETTRKPRSEIAGQVRRRR
jgi:FHA domain-containing protein